MIFLTVGTQFPFDRLVKTVDDISSEGLISEEIFAQIGESRYKPRNFESVQFLDKRLFDSYVQKASCVIGHAGVGTIMIALDNEKPLLVMPRLRKCGEVVDNHQVAMAKEFGQLGLILVAYDTWDLRDKILGLKTFVPRKPRGRSRAVIERISRFLNELLERR